MLRLAGTLSFIWLVLAISAEAQNPVVDTNGQPVRTGVQYHILPAMTDVAGGLTLVNRNGSCPLYVGQEPLATVVSSGLPVTFRPYAAGETVIRESRDLIVQFEAASTCVQSTSWRIGERDPKTNRRFIVTGGRSSYFRIDKINGLYNLVFCPSESCPNCRVACGSAGILIENGKRLVALDGPNAFPFRFRRA